MVKDKKVIFWIRAVVLLAVAAAVFFAGREVGAASSQPGTQSDPLVTLSYLEKRLKEGGVTSGSAGSAAFESVSLSSGEKLTLADGRKIAKVHPPKPVFDNPADQVIALAVSAKPGESMPPLPNLNGIDEDFAKSLLSPIKINDDDPDEIKELKAKVIETKAYLVEEIKNGGSVIEALKAHQAEMERIADSRLMAIREMQKLQSEGDPEMAREFAEKVNESFRARGIPEIPVPKK